MPTRDMEKYPLDGILNPNTLMQLYIFCKQTDPETLRKCKTDPLQHSLPPMPTRDMEKYPLDGTLNPNTLMQLYIFCKQSFFYDPDRSRDAEKEKTDPATQLPPMPTRDMEKYPLDGTRILTPHAALHFLQADRSGDAEKEKTDTLQHSLPPMPTRDMEKYPLDGTLNPNTLMQLYIFCKQ
ncbi:Natural Cytotoxicity Triggering Receptor 3 Ligand 1, partial [Manis pentadactyla]